MPLTWDTATYAQAYDRYNRQWAIDSGFILYKNALTRLASRSTYTPAEEVLFIGCGFGYWLEHLLTIPGVQPGNVWGIDNGPHITANKSDPAFCDPAILPKVLDLDIFSPGILDDLKPFFGGNGKVGGWIVSTLVLTSLQTDQEIADFSAACENLKAPQGNIAHIFTSEITDWAAQGMGGDPHDRSLGMNWQPREYWSTRLPDHWLFDQHGGVWAPDVGAWTEL